MWVSRKDMEEIQKQLAELQRWKESHSQDVVNGRNFTVYSASEKAWHHSLMHSFQMPVSQQIDIKTVIEKILERLGMELVYVSGTPAAVEMQKKKAKAA